MCNFLKCLIGIIAVLAISCESPPEPKVIDIGVQYFPMKVGMYHIYDVYDIQYKLGVPDTFQYELKTHVVDSFMALNGKYRYVIYRSTRESASDNWTYLDTWSAQVDNNEAVLTKGNISFVQLMFPVKQGLSWNGNKYNTVKYDLEEFDSYAISNVDTVFVNDHEKFINCITVVEEAETERIILYDVRYAIYAPGVGLVYEESNQLNYYCSDKKAGCPPAPYNLDDGHLHKQSIKSYGLEK